MGADVNWWKWWWWWWENLGTLFAPGKGCLSKTRMPNPSSANTELSSFAWWWWWSSSSSSWWCKWWLWGSWLSWTKVRDKGQVTVKMARHEIQIQSWLTSIFFNLQRLQQEEGGLLPCDCETESETLISWLLPLCMKAVGSPKGSMLQHSHTATF